MLDIPAAWMLYDCRTTDVFGLQPPHSEVYAAATDPPLGAVVFFF